MPRKTKKQKIKTGQRQTKTASKSNPQELVKGEFSFDLQTIKQKSSGRKRRVKSLSFENSGTKPIGLSMSILLGLSLLGLELVIYWAQQHNIIFSQ